MYLLDTNHCSRIIAGNSAVIQQLQAHHTDGIATSVIVRGELLYMVQKSEQQIANFQQVNRFLETIDLYPISKTVADIYGGLKGKIVEQLGPRDRAKRRQVTIQSLGFSDNDLWIAATAFHYNLVLVSADNDFTRLQQIESFSLESWLG